MSIALDHVSKRFSGHLALDEVSLEVAEGELFVLLGGSGSGKSTALRIIAGLTPPDEGRVLLQGKRVDHLPPQARGVGFVFQNYSLFRHMTIGQNIEFGMRVHRVPSAERVRRREELLSLVGLVGMAGAQPARLSGGQQQRVAVARALAYRPAVLLMDEPFGALDVRTRAHLRKSFRDIHDKLKITTIFVTHDQEEAFELADRIGILERGHLVEVGPPAEMYRRPKTELAARFLGAANLMVGEIHDDRLRVGESMLTLPPDAPRVTSSMEVKVLIRPEDLEVRARPDPTAEQQGRSLGKGTILDAASVGPSLRLRIGIPSLRGVPILSPEPGFGQGEPVLHSHARPEIGGTRALVPGETVHLSLRDFHVIPHEGISVLMCIDGSQSARIGLEFGATVAARMHAQVVILGVAEKPNEENHAREGLLEATQAYSGKFPSLKTRFRAGSAAERILEEVESQEYGLLVAGFRGRHGPARSMGSTTERLVRLSRVPLLIVPEIRPSLQKILLCMATGATGRSDVLFAGRLAGVSGARTTLLHILGGNGDAPGGSGEHSRTREYILQLTSDWLARGARTLQLMGVPAELKVRDGSVVEGILEEARDGDYDLIALGAPAPPRAAGTWRREIVDAVLERAKRPVLIIPAAPNTEQ